MKIVKCDLCGAPCANSVEDKSWSMNLIPPDIYQPSWKLDLCNDCAEKLKKYIRKEENREADHTAEGHTPKMS